MDLLEYELHVQRMEETFKDILNGEKAIVVVSGEAGIKKTAFDKAMPEPLRSSTQLPCGACVPLFIPLPPGPIHDSTVDELPPILKLLKPGADFHSRAACRSC